MRGGAWCAIALAILLLPAAKADWLQPGYDAAQTGNTPEAGPAWDDVVFERRMPVAAVDQVSTPVLVIHGSAYVVYGASGSENHLDRVSLTTAANETVARPGGGFIQALASDGSQVYTLGDIGFVTAFSLSGKPIWTSRVAPLGAADPSATTRFNALSNCYDGTMLVDAGHVYVACNAHSATLYVAAYDAATGHLDWDYVRDGTAPIPNGSGGIPVASAGAAAIGASVPPAAYLVVPTGLTKLGDVVVVASLFFETPPAATGSRGAVAYGEYDAIGPDGKARWVERTGVGGDASERQGGSTGSANAPPPATGDAQRAFLELAAVEEWLPGNTGPYPDRYVPIRAQGAQLEGDPASGFALAPEGLYATSLTGLWLLDSELAVQRSTSAPDGREWGPGPLTRAANGFLYARTGALGAGLAGTHASAAALRANTLEPMWQHPFPADTQFAIDDGLLVAWSRDGTLTVLGHNAASPQPVAKVSTAIPAPGDLVRVDLAASKPGLFGNVTSFRADWGDGSPAEWQSSPVFEHRFSTLTNVESRFFVRNDANQTASITQLFVVGGRPELTFLQRQFASDHQNTTFFILGLIATALAALWGVIQIRRSHHRLRRELNALEERLTSLRDRPESLDEALRSFRDHAKDLLTRRKLDQAQYLVLRERIDDVHRSTRMAVVDERLAFLPHGIVRRLEAMLGDAHVTGWERHHFLQALDQETLLTPAQKNQVRGLVDSWFKADQTPAGTSR